MSQIKGFKFYRTSYKASHLKIVSNFFSGGLGVGLGLIIGNYLGWL
ncbi:MAG: hypothetical protein AB4368_00050 [Xenococcaceae cyanobacterium]